MTVMPAVGSFCAKSQSWGECGHFKKREGFLGSSDSKVSACNEGDLSSIPGSGQSLGGGNGNPLQYSCLEDPMDGDTW